MHTAQLDPSLTCARYTLDFVNKFISPVHGGRAHFKVALLQIFKLIFLDLMRDKRGKVIGIFKTRECLSVKEKVEFTRFSAATSMLGALRSFSRGHGRLKFEVLKLACATTGIETIHAGTSFLLEDSRRCSCHWLNGKVLLVNRVGRRFGNWL